MLRAEDAVRIKQTVRYTAYAVFDESGDAGRAARASRYLVAAAIVCSNLEPLRKAILRVRRNMPRSLRGKAEVKAFETPASARLVLRELAATDVRICAAIVEKQRAAMRDPTETLILAYAACTSAALRDEYGIIATIDRPFTNKARRDELILAMSEAAEEMDRRLLLVMDDSQHEKALQAADVVAWAFFQKYERGRAEYCEIVQERITAEVLLP